MTKVSEFLEKMYEEPSQELENEMLEEIIMKANFLSYINRPDNGKTDVFSINMLLTDDKKLYLPVFTDVEELAKWGIPEEMDTIELNFDNYSEIILDHPHDIEGLVINPFGKSYIISEEWLSELRTMKEERLKVRELKIPVNSKILLSEPEKFPTMLAEEVTNCCDEIGTINRLWLLEMTTEKDESWLLVVDFKGDKNEIFREINDAARNYLGMRYLDMIAYDDEFAKKIKEGILITINQFKKCFEKHGVSEIATDTEFDPNVHNAVLRVDSEEKQSGQIVQALQKGYMINGRVLRPAMVSVAN